MWESTWPFDALQTIRPAPRTWSFVERSRPIFSLGEADEPDVSQIHEGANGDVRPIYVMARMVSESPRVEGKPHDRGKQVMVLGNSGASGKYLENQRIPDQRLLERVDLTVPQKILTAIRRRYGKPFTGLCP